MELDKQFGEADRFGKLGDAVKKELDGGSHVNVKPEFGSKANPINISEDELSDSDYAMVRRSTEAAYDQTRKPFDDSRAQPEGDFHPAGTIPTPAKPASIGGVKPSRKVAGASQQAVMSKQAQLVAAPDTREAIRAVNDGSAIVDPMPGMPPLETTAQDIDARAPIADTRMAISKTHYQTLEQLESDVGRISRNLTDPSIPQGKSFLVESLTRYREALNLQTFLESQLGKGAQMEDIDAWSGEEVRGLFNQLRDAMAVLSKKVGEETGSSLASRITAEKMASSHAEGQLGARDFTEQSAKRLKLNN